MAQSRTLTSAEIQEIGETLYGKSWQGGMARMLGVPRQSIAYYLKSGGADRTQAAAIIGLVARQAAHELRTAKADEAVTDARRVVLSNLLVQFDPD